MVRNPEVSSALTKIVVPTFAEISFLLHPLQTASFVPGMPPHTLDFSWMFPNHVSPALHLNLVYFLISQFLLGKVFCFLHPSDSFVSSFYWGCSLAALQTFFLQLHRITTGPCRFSHHPLATSLQHNPPPAVSLNRHPFSREVAASLLLPQQLRERVRLQAAVLSQPPQESTGPDFARADSAPSLKWSVTTPHKANNQDQPTNQLPTRLILQ